MRITSLKKHKKSPIPIIKKGREFTRVATLVDAKTSIHSAQLTPAKRLNLLNVQLRSKGMSFIKLVCENACSQVTFSL